MLKIHSSGLELAQQVAHYKTSSERRIGMLRYSEAPSSFVAIFHLPFGGFFPAVHTFGMKFPIDIVFCNSNKEVLHLYSNVKADRFILPWKNFFGGCRFLLEFSNCNIQMLKRGDRLVW